ncbi:Bromodomain protein [Cordyceps fumosorosea ARSEF 2679]|uniref:Bromodomain protein n=1 Tax=Cordyceps fumosorosea (strain ARSEF 2679) TaxID=1081104 RepID=A0A162N0X2_CORFA|nr:Bromodomain protein [Cordyceps fumosorosea ARSEF 2679]OAA73759.1 Bromodomain protein [Cordyceps fumosorosea ARSEF 2679]
MTGRRSSALARRKSATPHSDEDVEMANNSPDGIESDAEGEMVIDARDDLYATIERLSTLLCTISEDGEELAAGFQRIPNRRTVPDYFEIISDPVAFSTVRGKIQKKQYSNLPEFVKDVSQIFHNAQVYNRPSAPIFGAAIKLQGIFRQELDKLVQSSIISKEEAALPDLGELPPVEESPPRDSEAENSEEDDDDDDDDDDDEEEEDDDDDDEYGAGVGRRGRRRQQRMPIKDRDVDMDDDSHRARGRPPMVLTPVEARISSVLKSIRRLKANNGALLITPFEKLPDRSTLPDYYQTITTPIALDNIKTKAKRKKYNSVDNFLDDMNLMFENAKAYNEDQSELHKAAIELQNETQSLAEQEKAKSDDEFRDEDGKLSVDHVEHGGNIWRVGDWVHIRNPNDLAKPTVGQIFRMWQDREGEKLINACWYYRPEQTVHRFEKHFFEHEVVKTGQYRDHLIGEVVDRCFVMFVTRFNKGRPRGLAADKHVYVCESRYNEENFRFNKIKTWASCVPDEVRDRDYEMDLFDTPHPMRKVPSPIKHLLREDAKALSIDGRQNRM